MRYLIIEGDLTVREPEGAPDREDRRSAEEEESVLLRVNPVKGVLEQYIGDGDWDVVLEWTVTAKRQKERAA